MSNEHSLKSNCYRLQDAKSEQMLDGLIEAALSSPLKSSFEPMYRQLQAMRMDRQAFVITSVIGEKLIQLAPHPNEDDIVRAGAMSCRQQSDLLSHGLVIIHLQAKNFWTRRSSPRAPLY